MSHRSMMLRLQGTGLEPFRTGPVRIGFCLHGTLLTPVRNGSKTDILQVQFWIRSGPVPERSRILQKELRPTWFDFLTGSIWRIRLEPARLNIALGTRRTGQIFVYFAKKICH